MADDSVKTKEVKRNLSKPEECKLKESVFDAESRIQAVLRKGKYSNRKQILVLSDPDLANLAGLTCQDAKLLKQLVAKQLISHIPFTAYQILTDESLQHWRLPAGCSVIDKVLKGGILSRVITEISGESACGKTQLCLQLCLSVQLVPKQGGGAVYICTEDVFPSRRLQQLIKFFSRKKRGHKFGDNIFIEHVADFEGLEVCVERRLPALLAQDLVKLVVIDSVAALFRCHYTGKQMMERAQHMSQFASVLLKLATQHNIPIVCVNQVSASMDRGAPNSVTPALGLTWANQITCRIMMSRPCAPHSDQNPQPIKTKSEEHTSSLHLPTHRELSLVFAPHLTPTRMKVYIDDNGIHGLDEV